MSFPFQFSLRSFAAVFVFPVCFVSCAKSGADSFTGPVTGTDTSTAVNSCPIAQENYTQPSTVDPQWNIYYGADGDFFNAGGYNASGMKNSSLTTGTGVMNLQTDGATKTFHFNSDFFTGMPSQYTVTDASGGNQTRAVAYNDDGTISGISLTDAVSGPLAAITMDFGMGDLTRLSYQEKTGAEKLRLFYIDTYDGNHNPFYDLKGSAFLFYNWEYFTTPPLEMGKVFQHLSKNNWTHFSCTENGVKTIEESISYEYNSKGYPTTGTLRVLTFALTGDKLTDDTYAVTYTFPCQ